MYKPYKICTTYKIYNYARFVYFMQFYALVVPYGDPQTTMGNPWVGEQS